MNTTYEKLKKIIVKEIPEITQPKIMWFMEKRNFDKEATQPVVYAVLDGEQMPKMAERMNEFKFIKKEFAPRPITLEDVLIVLEEDRELVKERFYFSSKGYLKQTKLNTKTQTHETIKQVIWLLGKPLSEQPEETLKFILELIK